VVNTIAIAERAIPTRVVLLQAVRLTASDGLHHVVYKHMVEFEPL
jgi:hypothetical protein